MGNKNGSKSALQDGLPLGVDVSAMLMAFEGQVGGMLGPKNDPKKASKNYENWMAS